MPMKKRSLLGEETLYDGKRSKQNKYGDGASWFRGAIIGKGSFGCVFMANLKKPKSKYSSYPPTMAVKSAEVSVSGSIQKEKEVMDNIRGCPNVIRCFGEEITTGEDGQMVYNLLLEYGSGGTLAHLIKKSGQNGLPEFDTRRYTRSILNGLTHIHRSGYVHCDLKPENVLLVGNSRNADFIAKIGDLGLAKRAKSSKKSKLDSYWRGTPMYLSPEAVIAGVQEPPADIWALGCIVLEMLTGKPPWFPKQDSDKILNRIRNEKDSPCIPSIISAAGKSFLKGCFSRKITSRFTADMLLDHPFLKGLTTNAEESPEVLDINSITSSPEFSDDDDDGDSGEEDEPWSSSYSSYTSEDGLSSWSEEDARLHEVQQFPKFPVSLAVSKRV